MSGSQKTTPTLTFLGMQIFWKDSFKEKTTTRQAGHQRSTQQFWSTLTIHFFLVSVHPPVMQPIPITSGSPTQQRENAVFLPSFTIFLIFSEKTWESRHLRLFLESLSFDDG